MMCCEMARSFLTRFVCGSSISHDTYHVLSLDTLCHHPLQGWMPDMYIFPYPPPTKPQQRNHTVLTS